MAESLLHSMRHHAKRIQDASLRNAFLARIDEGSFTSDETPQSHVCVFFAAIDRRVGQVFIGLHKKSGLWLFNGGHLKQHETLEMAVERETVEEWGIPVHARALGYPSFHSITHIDNPGKQPCRLHFDFWYIVPVNKTTFQPDPAAVAEEFAESGWFSFDEARQHVQDPATAQFITTLQAAGVPDQ